MDFLVADAGRRPCAEECNGAKKRAMSANAVKSSGAEKTLVALAQQVFLHLAHGVTGQFGLDEAAFGDLEVGQLRLERGHQRIAIQLRARLGRDHRQPTSPKSGCGTPTMADSCTPGMSFSTLSISAG